MPTREIVVLRFHGRRHPNRACDFDENTTQKTTKEISIMIYISLSQLGVSMPMTCPSIAIRSQQRLDTDTTQKLNDDLCFSLLARCLHANYMSQHRSQILVATIGSLPRLAHGGNNEHFQIHIPRTHDEEEFYILPFELEHVVYINKNTSCLPTTIYHFKTT